MHQLTLNIPFGSAHFAEIACRVLSVDREPKQSQVQRAMAAEGEQLRVSFSSPLVKPLRTSVSSFLEFAALVARTIAEFGDGAEQML
eukprot:jgi/Hompol1/5720/HPOL_002037-RA